MAENSVTTNFFANSKDAEAALLRLEKKYADMENKVKHLSQQSRRQTQDVMSSLKDWVGGLAGIAAGYAALPAVIGRVIDANREMYEQADQISLKYDEMFRKFRSQAGLGALEGEAAKKQIKAVGIANAVMPEFAEAASRQLVSSGFSVEDAIGPALDVLLKGLKAGNLAEGDPKAMTQAFGQFLAAQGLDKNAENLSKAVIYSQRLFKTGDLEVSDLSSLAGRSQAAAGKLSLEETFGVFNTLREKTGADKASTAFQALIDRMTGFVGDPEAKKALRKAGMKAGDVDLVGENVLTALDRLAAGAEKVPEEKRSAWFQDLFGKEVGSPIQGLIRDRAKIAIAMEQLKDTTGFDSDVATAISGPAAARTRAAALREGLIEERDTGFEGLLKASETLALEKGASPLAISTGLSMSRMLKFLGLPEETAFNWAAGGTVDAVSSPGEGSGFEQSRRRLAALERNSDEEVRLLTDILETLRKREPRREGAGLP